MDKSAYLWLATISDECFDGPPYAEADYITHRQATSTVVDAAADSPLVKQRRNRPVSPHLGIYQPQITWIPSMLNRLTGIAMSGPFYLFGIGYLVAPALGWHLESAVLAASFGAWPVAAKVAVKALAAFPFVFHSLNGLRHLAWDFGKQITNQQVKTTGWVMIGATVVTSLYLAVGV
jgi:succinate dehydrogenase (ubiquinone) cytochrome b560 subunit